MPCNPPILGDAMAAAEEGGRSKRVAAAAAASQKVADSDDLILNILHRLPLKTVAEFELVCRRWRFLITHPSFPRRLSIRQFPPSHHGFFFHCRQEDIYKFAPINDQEPDVAAVAAVPNPSPFSFQIRVLHSCNGLLLTSETDYTTQMHKYFVRNPITKESFSIRTQTAPLVCCGLAFDPPPESPHYKVVVIERCLEECVIDATRIFIYSSKTTFWTDRSDLNLRLPQDAYYEKVALWKGALHWAAADLPSTLSFHVEEERFWQTPRQPFADASPPTSASCLGLAVSFGRLKLIGEEHHMPPMKLRISVMSDDYKQWFVQYRVDLDPPQLLQPHDDSPDVNFLCLLSGRRGASDEDEEVMLLSSAGKIISYRIRDGAWKDICQVNPPTPAVSFIHMHFHTLSLVEPRTMIM